MRRQAIALTVCVALSVPLLPATALAGGRPLSQRGFNAHGGSPAHGGFQAIPEFRPQGAFGSPGGFPFAASRGHHGRFARVSPGHFSHRFLRHTFFPWFPSTAFRYAPPALYGPSVDTSSPVVSVSPIIYASPTVYVSPLVVSSEPAPVAAPPFPAPALPSVVEHPTGRYELRGDGVATPFVWVWIPNPPPAPPAAPPPSPEEPPAGSALSVTRSKTYRWTDEEGTTFWTNRLEKIPEPYRSRAQGTAQVVSSPRPRRRRAASSRHSP